MMHYYDSAKGFESIKGPADNIWLRAFVWRHYCNYALHCCNNTLHYCSNTLHYGNNTLHTMKGVVSLCTTWFVSAIARGTPQQM